MLVQNQSQLIWGIKDKLNKFCSVNDMKELLIANGQEVPSGESNVRDCIFLFSAAALNSHYSFAETNMFNGLSPHGTFQ